MGDVISQAIEMGHLNTGNISFQRIRAIAGIDTGLWDQLDRGRATLPSYNHLNQYLYSYALMVSSQWDAILQTVELPSVGDLRLLDYGCGQALALVKLFDKFGAALIDRVKEIVLIEPSPFALARAEKIVRCYCPDAHIVCINKKFDELTYEELFSATELHNLHTISNALDIDSFNHFELFRSMILSRKGSHTVFAVSFDREFKGGSSRFFDVADALVNIKNGRFLDFKHQKPFGFNIENKEGKQISNIGWCFGVDVLKERPLA